MLRAIFYFIFPYDRLLKYPEILYATPTIAAAPARYKE
jgi:hypothetical protein